MITKEFIMSNLDEFMKNLEVSVKTSKITNHETALVTIAALHGQMLFVLLDILMVLREMKDK